jgi:Na+/H+ antiporter NhaD/arsenite permease-like protein
MLTAVLSNVVSNVPAVLLFKPVIPSFGEPARAWLILAMASTLAGVVEAAREARVEIGFLEDCRVGVPLTIMTLVFGWLVLIVVPV